MRKIFTFLSLFIAGSALAQDQYLITFKDKGPEAVVLSQQPSKILSEKALARRAKNQVKITSEDLPVSRKYLQQLQQNGIEIRQKSKWLNTALIETSLNETALLHQFPAIKTVKKITVSAARSTNKFPEINQP